MNLTPAISRGPRSLFREEMDAVGGARHHAWRAGWRAQIPEGWLDRCENSRRPLMLQAYEAIRWPLGEDGW
jgi:hypothetical protein